MPPCNLTIKHHTCFIQEGWCDSMGSVEEIQAKLLKRQEAAAKRERAMAYALAHQVSYCLLLSHAGRKCTCKKFTFSVFLIFRGRNF